jgi:alpha-aminoadipic semialdehyde synthase
MNLVLKGSGKVYKGGKEVFKELKNEYVKKEMIKKVEENGYNKKIYGCKVRRRNNLERKDGGGFEKEEYEKFK